MAEKGLFHSEVIAHTTRKLLLQRLALLEGQCEALLATADGHLAVGTAANEEKMARHAAISSALLALSQTFCEEVLGSQNDQASFSCADGNAVVVRLFLKGAPYQLCLSSGEQNNLATLMRAAQDMTTKIHHLIEN